MMNYYALCATKNNDTLYIANTHPIIWCERIESMKQYSSRYACEYEVLRDYDNYRYLTSQIEKGFLDNVYLLTLENTKVIDRMKLL